MILAESDVGPKQNKAKDQLAQVVVMLDGNLVTHGTTLLQQVRTHRDRTVCGEDTACKE